MAQKALQVLLDKQEITEVIYRYSRSLDRGDWEGLANVFHPDAYLPSHLEPGVVHKDAADFVAWMKEFHQPRDRTLSRVTNMMIEVDGDTAGSESYVKSEQRNKRADGMVELITIVGRYLDRWERRNGRWAMSARAFVCEFLENQVVAEQFPPELTPSSRNTSDPSYDLIDRKHRSRT